MRYRLDCPANRYVFKYRLNCSCDVIKLVGMLRSAVLCEKSVILSILLNVLTAVWSLKTVIDCVQKKKLTHK